MTDLRTSLKKCVIYNALSLIAVVGTVSLINEKSYWAFGPSNVLTVAGVPIDSYYKYIYLLTLITLIKLSSIYSSEIGSPIINFNVYNPDKKIITEFSKLELQFYANTMSSISAIRDIFTTLIVVSQFDIALFSVIIGELATIYTVRLLLNQKEFQLSSLDSYADSEEYDDSGEYKDTVSADNTPTLTATPANTIELTKI
jgi:hypothetical protein